MDRELNKRVEVVRCKDCKKYEEVHGAFGSFSVCTAQGSMNVQKEPDDFCSWGERKNNAVD